MGKTYRGLHRIGNTSQHGEAPEVIIETENITVIPSKNEQIIKRSEGKYIDTATIKPIPDEYIVPEGALNIAENGSYNVKDKETVNVEVPGEVVNLQDKSVTPTKEPQNVSADEGYTGLGTVEIDAIPDEYIIPSGTLEITENNTYDVTDKASVIVNVASTGGANGLQWVCDNMKTLKNMFTGYKGESLDEPLSGLDTSKVEDFSSCFSNNTALLSLPDIDMSSASNATSMFYQASKLSKIVLKNINKTKHLLNCKTMFFGSKMTEIVGLDLTYATDISDILRGNSNIKEFIHPETSNVVTFGNTFANCYALETLVIDVIKSSSTFSSTFSNLSNLKNVTIKNIKKNLQLYNSPNLTIDSVIGIFKELWDFSSGTTTYTLSLKTVNTELIANTYVKLVEATDEMIAEDPNIASKKPCVVCESTDEGAMLITEYATSKNWTIKTYG